MAKASALQVPSLPKPCPRTEGRTVRADSESDFRGLYSACCPAAVPESFSILEMRSSQMRVNSSFSRPWGQGACCWRCGPRHRSASHAGGGTRRRSASHAGGGTQPHLLLHSLFQGLDLHLGLAQAGVEGQGLCLGLAAHLRQLLVDPGHEVGRAELATPPRGCLPPLAGTYSCSFSLAWAFSAWYLCASFSILAR